VTDTTTRIAAGAGWLYGHRWIERLLDFAAVVVLARMLSPDDFGLVAIAASVIAIIEGLSMLGIDKALIRTRDDDRELYDSAWTLAVLRGLASALVMVAIASVLEDPRIAAVLWTLAWVPVLNGLANPRFVTFERDLVYSRLALLTLAARVLSVAATLAVAFATRSYWALVIGLLVNAGATCALSFVLRPYVPRPSFARVRTLFAFGGWLTLTGAVTALSMETDRIIVGRLLGITEAGLYDMTQRVGVLPTRELLSPLQRLLLPAFSQLLGDRPRFRGAVRESINVLASLSLPAAFGFALVAADFVPLTLGAQWTPIVPLLVVLVPYLGVRATLSMTLPCVLALGNTRLLFGVSLAYALVHVPVFVAGTILFGLRGAIWGIVLAGVVYTLLNAWMLWRLLAIRPGEILAEVRRPLLASSLMCAAVMAVAGVTGVEPMPSEGSWTSAAVKVLTGAVVHVSAQYALWTVEGRPAGIERRLSHLMAGYTRS
jgi:lipopolysaccharide exporter